MAIVINGQTGIDAGHLPISNAGNTEIEGTLTGADVTVASITANSVITQGQNVTPFSGFKNYIINGNFDVWQRGTSQTTAGYGSADRWFIYATNTIPTTNKSLGNTGYNNAINATGIAGNTDFAFIQNIESINAKTFATSSGVLSFWFYSSTNRPSKIAIKYPNVLDTFTATIVLIIQDVLFLSGWNKYTLAIPANANYAKGMQVSIGGYGMALTSGNIGLAQVQLEEGSVATPFENRPYGLELSLCQRYYEVGRCIQQLGIGTTIGVALTGQVFFTTSKRIVPTITYLDNSGAQNKVTLINNSGAETNGVSVIAGNSTNNDLRLTAITTNTTQNGIGFTYTASAEL